MEWITLANAAAVYDEGTLTRPTPATPAYLARLVRAGRLTGRIGDTGPEIRSASLDLVISRDLESFVRRDQDGLAS